MQIYVSWSAFIKINACDLILKSYDSNKPDEKDKTYYFDNQKVLSKEVTWFEVMFFVHTKKYP